MNRPLIFASLAAVALAGCNSPKTVVQNDTKEPVVTGESPGTTPSEPVAPNPETGTKHDPAKPNVKPTLPVNKPTMEIKVPKTGTGGWKPTKLTLDDIGAKVAAATRGLRNTKADTIYLARTSQGEGTYRGEIAIVDPKKFRIDYVVNSEMPMSGSDISDGTKRMVRLGEKFTPPMPAGKPLAIAQRPSASWAAMWTDDFNRMAFQGLTDGKDAWQPVFQEWKKGMFGFKPVVEERQMVHSGKMITNYRVRVERNAEMSKKLGPCAFEIVLDGTRFLPVTIRVERKDLNGKVWMTQWSAHWKFREPIQESSFQMPTNPS